MENTHESHVKLNSESPPPKKPIITQNYKQTIPSITVTTDKLTCDTKSIHSNDSPSKSTETTDLPNKVSPRTIPVIDESFSENDQNLANLLDTSSSYSAINNNSDAESASQPIINSPKKVSDKYLASSPVKILTNDKTSRKLLNDKLDNPANISPTATLQSLVNVDSYFQKSLEIKDISKKVSPPSHVFQAQLGFTEENTKTFSETPDTIVLSPRTILLNSLPPSVIDTLQAKESLSKPPSEVFSEYSKSSSDFVINDSSDSEPDSTSSDSMDSPTRRLIFESMAEDANLIDYFQSQAHISQTISSSFSVDNAITYAQSVIAAYSQPVASTLYEKEGDGLGTEKSVCTGERKEYGIMTSHISLEIPEKVPFPTDLESSKAFRRESNPISPSPSNNAIDDSQPSTSSEKYIDLSCKQSAANKEDKKKDGIVYKPVSSDERIFLPSNYPPVDLTWRSPQCASRRKPPLSTTKMVLDENGCWTNPKHEDKVLNYVESVKSFLDTPEKFKAFMTEVIEYWANRQTLELFKQNLSEMFKERVDLLEGLNEFFPSNSRSESPSKENV